MSFAGSRRVLLLKIVPSLPTHQCVAIVKATPHNARNGCGPRALRDKDCNNPFGLNKTLADEYDAL